MFLLSFSQLKGLHCSLQLLLPASFLCVFLWYVMLRVTPLWAGSAERLRWTGHGDFTFSAVIWIWKLSEKLGWKTCSFMAVSALEILGEHWAPHTKQFCCALSWQQGLSDEITKQPVQKQEEIPCPRMWLQRHPSQWKFRQIRNKN